MASVSTGCNAGPVYHATGGMKYPPSGPKCSFQVLATHPGAGYAELGQFTIEGDRSFGAGLYNDPQAFADKVRSEVCAAGGHALVTQIDGHGYIARGIVLRKTGDAATPAPAAAPAPTTPAEGCEPICSPGFRCVSGTCVPQCNPACAETETCGNDRLCHPKAGAK